MERLKLFPHVTELEGLGQAKQQKNSRKIAEEK